MGGLVDRDYTAKFLSVSKETVIRLERRGRLKRIENLGGRAVRYKIADVHALAGA
jgi:hypothetical protein